jgi:drug/metabolite transporter superfamily protein YnfA
MSACPQRDPGPRVEPGSLAWGIVADGFHRDRYDIIGALTCLLRVAVIMY